MDYKTSIRLLFEAALLEGERKMQMKRDSDEYPGGPAEKRLMTSKPGTLSASGKKQLAAAATAYEKATSKKVESIRNNFSLILKESDFWDDPTQYPRTINNPNEKEMTPDLAKKVAATETQFKAREAGRQNNPRPLSTKLRRLGQVAVGRAARRLGLRPKNQS